jgi:hypothetical protein
MKRFVSSMVAVCAATASVAVAQMPTAPPKVISIYREEVKPARGISHTAVEASLAQLWAKNGAQPYMALSAVTGNATDVLFVSSYAGWDAVDKDMAAYDKGAASSEFAQLAKQEAELVTSAKATMAVFREDLSYNPGKLMEQLPHGRYVWIRTVRAKPGHAMDFAEMQKLNIKTHVDAKMDEAWVGYQVVAGAQNGTFLFFQVASSLAEEEGSEKAHKAMRDAAGADFAAAMKKHADEDLASDQADLYALSPKMSHVTKEFAAADAEFWTPKPATAPAARKVATKKEEKKP